MSCTYTRTQARKVNSMGYRLHFAKTYHVEYGGGSFNWQSEEFAQMLSENMENDFYNDEQDSYEILPSDLQEYIEKVRKLAPEEPSKYFGDYTNKEEADALQEIIDGYDKTNDYIKLEWF